MISSTSDSEFSFSSSTESHGKYETRRSENVESEETKTTTSTAAVCADQQSMTADNKHKQWESVAKFWTQQSVDYANVGDGV